MAKPWNLARRFAPRASGVVLGVCGVLTLMLGGCRAVDNAQVDVLERELRQQEDYIYELEDYLIEYSEKLRQCRSCQPEMMMDSTSTTTTKRSRAKQPTLANDPPLSPAPRRPNGSRVAPPIEDPLTPVDAFDAAPLEAPALPAPSLTTAPATRPEVTPAPVTPTTPPPAPATPLDPAEIEAPGLEIGPTSDLDWGGAAPIATTPPGDEAPPYIPDPADYQLDAEISASDADVAAPPIDDSMVDADEAPQLIAPEPTQSAEVAETVGPTLPPASDPARLVAQRLQIRKVFRGGANSEGSQPQSLMVVVEALNATDEPVDANGEVSLMVMAGETQETLQRVERWDFTSDETQAAWQSSALGDGLHLELPLQAKALPEGRLELWARLVNADGVKLLTRVPFAAEELGPLELPEGQAAPTESQNLVAEVAPDIEPVAVIPQSEPAVEAATEQPASTQWRASNESRVVGPVVASASTVGGATTSGWTKQAPGRAPVPPRVATASGAPRWQQGSGEEPAGGVPSGWTPFR